MNPRPNGGYDNEIDILAYHPETKELIHAVPSWDANSWDERKARYRGKKFVFSEEQYRQLIGGAEVTRIRKLAIARLGQSARASLDWGHGFEVVLILVFIRQIADVLATKSPLSDAVPGGFPILQDMQFALHYRTG